MYSPIILSNSSTELQVASDPSGATTLQFPAGEISKSQIKKLREASARFMEAEFLPQLQQQLLELEIAPSSFTLTIEPIPTDDVDPRIIILRYRPIAEATDGYVEDKVKIEIGARSLREPCVKRPIQSIFSTLFPDSPTADPVFEVEVNVDGRFTWSSGLQAKFDVGEYKVYIG